MPIFLLCAFVPIFPLPLCNFFLPSSTCFSSFTIGYGLFYLKRIPKIYRQHQAAAVGNVKGLLLDIRGNALGNGNVVPVQTYRISQAAEEGKPAFGHDVDSTDNLHEAGRGKFKFDRVVIRGKRYCCVARAAAGHKAGADKRRY